MKFRNVLGTSIAAIVAFATLAGCSGTSAGSTGAAGSTVATVAAGAAGPPEKTNIVIDAFPAIDSAGLFIAEQDGLFKAQGLNVTLKLPRPARRPSTGNWRAVMTSRPQTT